jgi:hypothetical protein
MSELKDWLKSRKKKPRNVKELAKMFRDVPYKTVSGWVYQDKIPAKAELKQKLYQITKIDKYMPQKIKNENLKKVQDSLYALINQLEPFIRSKSLRVYFRKKIDKNNVAYLSSILEALLDEKKFQIWSSFQKINTYIGGKKGGKDNL